MKKAFTLAEVLITLGIIGVVSAMTIPTLVMDYQTRTNNSAASVFERKLGEALKVMNSQLSLSGHNSTESFVEELSNHIKISNICKSDDLLSCFSDVVYWGEELEAVDINEVKSSKNLGQELWATSVVGVQFASGVNALLSYNPECSQDPYSNQVINISQTGGSVNLGTDCIAILYVHQVLKLRIQV